MEASVEFLLGNLERLYRYQGDVLVGAEAELEALTAELHKFIIILKEASRKHVSKAVAKKWEKDIRDVVTEIENEIDTFVSHRVAEKGKRSSVIRNLFQIGVPVDVHTPLRKIRDEKIKPLLDRAAVDFATVDLAATTPFAAADDDDRVELATEIRQKKTQIVGFEEEATHFVNFLNGESDNLGIASIVGMAGLGKTTLASRIFEDERIKYEFIIKIWIDFSVNINIKNVLQSILSKYNVKPPNNMSVDGIKDKVREQLQSGKFLMVMDDVCPSDAWERLKGIFPKDNKLGRVVITTRHDDLAKIICTGSPHYLRFLNQDESWKLFQYEVYGELNVVPQELVDVGRVIATACDGLPLSLEVIGGILAEKNARIGDDVLGIKSEWEDVSKTMKPNLVGGDRKQLLASIISLSYENLPYELKPCFVYLGMFAEDAVIPVKKIIRLWIAEGFVQEKRAKSLEQTAYEYLKELINRSLVMVLKIKPDGEFKICKIHGAVRDFCKEEAQSNNLNLFHEINRNSQGVFEQHEIIEKSRRLSIHSYAHDFFWGKPKLPLARSFLSFSQSIVQLVAQDMSTATDAFGLLRVYEAKNIRFPKFPRKLVQLLHLRYLTIVVVTELRALPDIMTDLWNLQTLTVDTAARTLDCKGDIWKLLELRHVKTKAAITLKKDGCDGGHNLQTLSRLSPNSCTEEVFTKAKNLITLGIQGDLNDHSYANFLNKLERLNKLKLAYELIEPVPSERLYYSYTHSPPDLTKPPSRPLQSLPDPHKFPTNLKILVVFRTYLEWKEIGKLSKLASLEVLKLKENAFKGELWESSEGGFLQLVRLHIEKADVVTWTAKTNSFPELKSLTLVNCEQLLEVPSVLEEKLEILNMENVTAGAVKSALAIEKEKQEQTKAFKLDIAPADRVKA